MALKKCAECDHEVSTKAKVCPKCGAVLKKQFSILGFIILFIIFYIISSILNDPNYRAKKIREKRKKACRACTRLLNGAIELYNIDQKNQNKKILSIKPDTESLLVRNKCLRKPIRKPSLECVYKIKGNLEKGGYVYCSYHYPEENKTHISLSPKSRQDTIIEKDISSATPVIKELVAENNIISKNHVKGIALASTPSVDFESQIGKEVLTIPVVAKNTAFIIGTKINLRGYPTLNDKAIKSVSEPLQVILLKERDDGWCEIEIPDAKESFYIWGAFLKTNSEQFTRLICISNTIVFTKSAKNSAKLSSIKKDGKILAYSNSNLNSWKKVLLPNGSKGWVLQERFSSIKAP